MSASRQQLEINFGTDNRPDGLKSWHAQRQEAIKKLAAEMGLPMGREVEVWLVGGVRLRGTLKVAVEMLIVPEVRNFDLELLVDGVPFKAAEIESCVRLD